MWESITQILEAIFGQISTLWVVYTTAPIISAFFALWVLDRIFHIFDILRK